MSIKRILLILEIIIIALTALRIGWIHFHAKPEHPPIEAGGARSSWLRSAV